MRPFLALLALLVSGCVTTAPEPVVVDSFCLSPASKKRTWNPEADSVETMREAVTFNRYVDRRCQPKRKP